MFQDLAVDSGYFIQDFVIQNSGSTYVEGSIRYANDNIYVLKYRLNFTNNTLTTTDSHYHACSASGLLSCNSPRILYIWGCKKYK